MRIFNFFKNDFYNQDSLRFFELDKVVDNSGDDNIDLYVGSINKDLDNNRINVLLDFEQPNAWVLKQSEQNIKLNESKFDYIFTCCKYTARWRNYILKKNKYFPIFLPLSKNYIKNNEKIYDVIYAGNIHRCIRFLIPPILKYNYRIISAINDKYVTDNNVAYNTKIDLMSKSKCSIVHNGLFAVNCDFFKRYQDYNLNGAFLGNNMMPQLKWRVFEAGFSKSLILCLRDQWNVIEDYFTPDKDFIYFDINNIDEILNDVIFNYDKYKYITENAYIKCIDNYTSEHFYHTIKNTIKEQRSYECKK